MDTGSLISNPDAALDRPGEAGMRAEVFLQAMARMGYAALNIGLGDLPVGVEALRKLAARHHIPLISTNILHTATQTPVFTPLLVRKVGLLRIGVFGLMSRDLSLGAKGQPFFADAGLSVSPPADAAAAAVAALKEQHCDMIVLLSQLTRKELDDVMQKVPGIDLALGSTGQEMSSYLSTIGTGHFADAFQKGKYIGQVTVNLRANRQHYYAADARSAAAAERSALSVQVMGFQRDLDAGPGPEGPLKPEQRANIERMLALTRAKLQQATERLEAEQGPPADASTLEFAFTPLGTDIRDDAEIDKSVKDFQEKFPKAAGGH